MNSLMNPVSSWSGYGAHNIIDGGLADIKPHHAIQGKMLSVTKEYAWALLEDGIKKPEEIKMELIELLAQKIYQDKLVEFTKQDNNVMGGTVFRARIFVVPDTNVKLLREHGIDSK